MAKASTDNSHADHGGFVSNTGTVPRSSEAVITGGALATFISWFDFSAGTWFDVSTGTDTISASGHGAHIAGGAGSVIADGAAAVNTNSAGSVHTTGALAQPFSTASGAFSDQVLWASRFPYKTCNDTTSFGGARSVIPDGATPFNRSSAWAFNTTGVLTQPWHTTAFKTGSHAINATDHGAQIAAGAGSVIATGAATVNTNCAGSVTSTGAATVETNSAGAVYTTNGRAQFSRTAVGTYVDQMLSIPRPPNFESRTGWAKPSDDSFSKTGDIIFNFGPGAQIAGPGAIIAAGAASVNTNTAAAVNTYEQISPGAEIAGAEAVIASGAAAVNPNNAGAVNTYEGVDVSWPTNTMISIVMLGGLGMLGGIAMLRIAGISSKNDAMRFVRIATAEGLSLKRNMHWWAARVIHQKRSLPPPTAAPPSAARGTYIDPRDRMVRNEVVNDINSGHNDSDNSTDDEDIISQDDTDIMVTDVDNDICNYPTADEDKDLICGDDDVDMSTSDDGSRSGSSSDSGSGSDRGSDSDSGSSSDDELHLPAPRDPCSCEVQPKRQ